MKMTQLFGFLMVLTVFSANGRADTGNFTISGMHCGSCAKIISAKLCKMEGVEKCEVKMGMATLTTKEGVALDAKKVESLVAEASDEYKVTKSEIKKSEPASTPAKK